MACVTLKRPVEVLGSPHLAEHQPLAKRKRCGPSLFPTTPSPTRGVKRAKRKLDIDDHYSPVSFPPPAPSPFLLATPPLDSGKFVARLEQELKRLQRRKAFASGEDASVGGSSSQLAGASLGSQGASSSGSSKDQPLFTLKQVSVICQRMLKERDEQVREEYQKVLTAKLAEQYDAFVKFNHDQVERRLAESAFSYVS